MISNFAFLQFTKTGNLCQSSYTFLIFNFFNYLRWVF
jgi:hypothetical protein